MTKNLSYDTNAAFLRIRRWAYERNIIEGSTCNKQGEKLTEEIGELFQALIEDNQAEVIDAIGDCVVVLTIMAAQRGLLIEDCIASAYEEIKDRKGKMINGIFVKESDLKWNI